MDWQPIETAPKDGTELIGLVGKRAITIQSRKHYVKWPHEEGGPTFKDVWTEVRGDELRPCNPTNWMPMPEPPSSLAGGSKAEPR